MTTLQVIGAGLGRTGTMSMKMALEEIGFKPCHHMRETFHQTERQKYYSTILNNGQTESEEAIKAIFEGFVAMVDYPGCMFYEELIKLNPNAKVILTIRDSPEAWAKSAGDTIFSGNKSSSWLKSKMSDFVFRICMPNYLLVIYEIIHKVHGVHPNDPKTDLAQMYTDWNNRVIETVPAEKLLVFNVKEGWKPLCDFLGVAVPDKPFPRVNSSASFKESMGAHMKRKMGIFLMKVLFVVALAVGAIVFFT